MTVAHSIQDEYATVLGAMWCKPLFLSRFRSYLNKLLFAGANQQIRTLAELTFDVLPGRRKHELLLDDVIDEIVSRGDDFAANHVDEFEEVWGCGVGLCYITTNWSLRQRWHALARTGLLDDLRPLLRTADLEESVTLLYEVGERWQGRVKELDRISCEIVRKP